MRAIPILLLVSLLGLVASSPASPPPMMQSAGSRGATTASPPAVHRTLDAHAIENYIAIQGSVELRIDPQEIRIVFALIQESETAPECRRLANERAEALIGALSGIGIDRDRVAKDFIALLPRYDWGVESRDGERFAVERRVGYQLQVNVHVSVDDEAMAQAASDEALRLGVNDVLAFDYWSPEVDAARVEARAQALQEAHRKAEVLLADFDVRPELINIDEDTRALYPQHLYRSFANDASVELHVPYRGDLPRITAPRAKNTYYHGPPEGLDRRSAILPMKPQISVIGTITLYFVPR